MDWFSITRQSRLKSAKCTEINPQTLSVLSVKLLVGCMYILGVGDFLFLL